MDNTENATARFWELQYKALYEEYLKCNSECGILHARLECAELHALSLERLIKTLQNALQD